MQPHEKGRNVPGATTSLVLGILGLVLCGILSPFAWSTGAEAERRARVEGYPGEGVATAGKILGMVGTAFLVVAVLFVLISVMSGG